MDVVVALDLPPDEVREMHRQFLQLQDMHELVRVFDEMQNYLPSLLELFRLIVHRRLNPNDIIDVLRTRRQLRELVPKLDSRFRYAVELDTDPGFRIWHNSF